MAKEELDAFFDALRSDKSLAEAFAAAAADVARNNGFDVDDQDVFDHFHGSEPAPRPLPPGGGRMTTMAMGEEGSRATTAAIGEEGSSRGMTGGIGEDSRRGKPITRPGVTSGAMGEEDRPTSPPSVTLAIGEEDRKRKPTTPTPDDDEAGGGTVTSMALGEEEKKRRDPPAHPITTMAVGEETRKPPKP